MFVGTKMIWTIAKRQVLENILGFRFIFGLLIFLSIMIACTLVRSNNYIKNLNDYHLRVIAQEEFVKKFAHMRRIGAVARPHTPPTKLSVLIREIPVDLTKYTEEESIYDNPIQILYHEVDLIFIFITIGSLFGVILTYDSISREIEEGTLRLMYSNSISRTNILLGKLAASNISIAVPLSISIVITSIILSLYKQIDWKFNEWFSFSIIFVIAFVYLNIFCASSIAISALSKKSSLSIIINLFIWVLFNLIIPNIAPYISTMAYSIPPASVLTNQIKIIDVEREEALKEKKREYISKGYTEAQAWELGNLDKVNEEYFQRIYKVQEEYKKKAYYQIFLAKNISCISPTACFVYSSLELAGGGFSRIPYAGHLLQTWGDTALDYLNKKIEKIKKENPEYSFDDFVDVSDVPRFVYKEQSLSSRLKSCIGYIGLNIFYLAILIIISFFCFQKTDIR